MVQSYWERCPFHESGQCPQETIVDRLSLLPGFVSPREVEAATATCESCAKRLGERRKHRRTRRPFRCVVFKEQGTTLNAKILDVSEGGALLELEEWVHFERGEKARLEIHSDAANPSESSRLPIEVVGLVTRVEPEKRRLAMAFLEKDAS
jgi:hypothetical protein